VTGALCGEVEITAGSLKDNMSSSMHSQRGEESTSGFCFLQLRPTQNSQPNVAIVYLHGSGERGEDLSLVTKYGLPAAASEGRAFSNCSILCPQLEAGAEWAPGRIADFVRWVKLSHENVALVGYSWGASGVCAVVSQFGAIASAFVAIAGRAPPTVVASQQGVQFLAIQGELDAWPNIDHFVPIINEQGGRATSVKLKGLAHYISEEAIAHPACTSILGSIGITISFPAHGH